MEKQSATVRGICVRSGFDNCFSNRAQARPTDLGGDGGFGASELLGDFGVGFALFYEGLDSGDVELRHDVGG